MVISPRAALAPGALPTKLNLFCEQKLGTLNMCFQRFAPDDKEKPMRVRHLKPSIALLMTILILPSVVYGENNPLRPGMAPSTSVPSLSSGTDDFVCGTYKGNQNETMRFHHLYQ